MAAINLLIVKRFLRSKSARSTIPIIPNPPSLYASQPKKLIDGSIFIRLNEFKRVDRDPKNLPPLLTARTGRYLSQTEIEEAKKLHESDPEQWTIGRLVKKFNAPYGLILEKVLSEKERQKIEQNDEDTLVNLSLHKLKGLMLRERIRLDRQSSF
jgi:hypothetical protein